MSNNLPTSIADITRSLPSIQGSTIAAPTTTPTSINPNSAMAAAMGTVTAQGTEPFPLLSDDGGDCATSNSGVGMGFVTTPSTVTPLAGHMRGSTVTQSQMIDLVNSYNSIGGAKRRRSSVEAVAAASSVLASFAATAKSQMSTMGATNNSSHYNPYSTIANQLPFSVLEDTAGENAVSDVSGGGGASGLGQMSVQAPPTFDFAAFAALPAHAALTSPAAKDQQQQLQSQMIPATTGPAQMLGIASGNGGRSGDAESPRMCGGGGSGGGGSRSRRGTKRRLSSSSSKTDRFEGYGDDSDNEGAQERKDVMAGMPLTPDAPGSGRPGSLRHLTPEERRARRLQRNRLAAKECRQKKKQYIKDLEERVEYLEKENMQLRKELDEMNAKLTLGVMRTGNTPILGNSTPLGTHSMTPEPSNLVSRVSAAITAATMAGIPSTISSSVAAAVSNGDNMTTKAEPLLFSQMSTSAEQGEMSRRESSPDPVSLLFSISSPPSPSTTNRSSVRGNTGTPPTSSMATLRQTAAANSSYGGGNSSSNSRYYRRSGTQGSAGNNSGSHTPLGGNSPRPAAATTARSEEVA